MQLDTASHFWYTIPHITERRGLYLSEYLDPIGERQITFSTKAELYALLEEGMKDIREGRLTPVEEVFTLLEQELENNFQ